MTSQTQYLTVVTICLLYQTLFLSKIEKYRASCRISTWLLRSYHHFQKHTSYTLGEEVGLESSVPLLKNKQNDGANFVSVGQRPSKGHVIKYLLQLGGGVHVALSKQSFIAS